MRKWIIGIQKFSKFSLALFVLISIFASMSILPVHADAITLNLTPSDAVVGDAITAFGFGATVNGEVKLYLENLVLTSAIADEAGVYSAQFAVPTVSRGSHVITAVDIESGEFNGAILTVFPRVRVTPTVGSFGDNILVNGEGFAAYEIITLWLEGKEVTPTSTPTTNFLGTFETNFQITSMPNGTYTFSSQDESGNSARTTMTVAPKILTQSTSGAPTTLILVYGYGFSESAEFTLFFDSIDLTPYGHSPISPEGYFITAFFVPDVPEGIHFVSARDSMGSVANCPFAVPSPIMMLTPDMISESSLITIEGNGFQPDIPVVLYLEDTVTTSLYDLMARTEKIIPRTDGSFHYSFMVPITGAGTYEVAAYQTNGPLPSDVQKVASATLTIMEHASVDADITAGNMHFRGEIAEFYLKTALEGELIDVQIDRAAVCFANGSVEQDLESDVIQISTGFYRITYPVPDAAPYGTYALLIEVSFHTDLLNAFGSAAGSFTISPFFTMQAAQLLDIQNDIATVIIPDLGTVKANLSTINARLSGIEGDVAVIESDIGTLRTSTEAIHATVTSIDDGVATVWSDLGTVKVKMAESSNQTNMAALFAVAAAIASSASAIILYRRRPHKPSTSPSTSPPTEKPPSQSAPAPMQPEKQEQTQTEPSEQTPKPAETSSQEPPPPAEQPPQTQPPPDSTTPEESPPQPPAPEPQPQIQPESELQPQTTVVPPEQPVPQ